MKHPRYILVTIVINIALVMLFTILHEYTSLSERYNQLGNNVKQAVDLALDSSIASEEMFSETYSDFMTRKMLSAGTTREGERTNAANESSNTLYYINGEFIHANVYTLAKVYEDHGHKMPRTVGAYNGLATDTTNWGTEYVYSWLYGGVAGFGKTGRNPNEEFKDFYDQIGKEITVVELFQKQDLSVVTHEHPVLENMGLLLDEGNRVGSEFNNMNTLAVRKNGKWYADGRLGEKYSYYYLTPNSLGVTYVPLKVFTPNFIANLDTIIRLQKLASGGDDVSSADLLNKADGCVPTKVYVNGTNHAEHTNEGHKIINDGTCEYDLDEVYTRVDYFVVDFYDTSNKDVVANIEGSITGNGMNQSTALTRTVQSLEASDTANTSAGQKKTSERIVAKVTVRIKVYIPYESALLQWLSYKDHMAHGGTDIWHASVKNFNPSTGRVIRDGDGTWFQYSTYTAVTR